MSNGGEKHFSHKKHNKRKRKAKRQNEKKALVRGVLWVHRIVKDTHGRIKTQYKRANQPPVVFYGNKELLHGTCL